MSDTVDQDQARLWERVSRNYSVPPITPSREDLAYCWEAANEWIQRRGSPRVLLLGVTPGLYKLPWPDGTDFLAVDHSQAMIDALWPGPSEAVRCADWLSMGLPEGSRDIVLCDGGVHLLDYPQGQRGLVQVLHRLLSDEGLCVFRLFALPPVRETPDLVIRDLREGRIGNPSALKLRLFMAMHDGPVTGVELGQVFAGLMEAVPDLEAVAARIGWPAEQVLSINNQKDLKCRLHMLTLEETLGLFCADPGAFQLGSVRIPSYELGSCCPTVTLQRRALGNPAPLLPDGASLTP
jgi:SAM-dependent methyltransferase